MAIFDLLAGLRDNDQWFAENRNRFSRLAEAYVELGPQFSLSQALGAGLSVALACSGEDPLLLARLRAYRDFTASYSLKDACKLLCRFGLPQKIYGRAGLGGLVQAPEDKRFIPALLLLNEKAAGYLPSDR